ncbi:hypothetical protein SAMD00023353_1600780 [Rosellinia necatrix]|uniref:Histidinolphosphatase-like protein n=1 Tax=Rosellinia necatrix TaxID=77044 RepID=A0A1W2TID1_ROSNE|nr:hypothetical protein SAMD00023353_1600780 [Rosellinia necatrix]
MTDDTTPTTAPAAPATAETSPDAISLRAPSKYLAAGTATAAGPSGTSTSFVAPSTEWLSGTWAVTHSTLSMWGSAQNVRITYTPRQPAAGADGNGPAVNDNLVEYENKGGRGGVKRVLGVEKPDPAVPGAWNWRGRGLLMIASSHWEVLGWGERPLAGGEGGVERWAVTWFAPTLFTEEGLDLYSDRREGLSKRTADDILAALKRLEAAPKLVQLVEKKMTEVAISLPWKEGSK